MKKMKQLTLFTLILVLSLSLVACGEKDTSTTNMGADVVDDVQTEETFVVDTTTGNEHEEVLTDDPESDSSDAVTYESYYEDLNNFGASIMADQEEMLEISTAFVADPTNPDNITMQATSLTNLSEILATASAITPTEDMLELHQAFETSCLEAITALEDLSAMLNDEFADANDETLQEYNELSQVYTEKFMAFTTNLFAVVDELQAKLN